MRGILKEMGVVNEQELQGSSKDDLNCAVRGYEFTLGTGYGKKGASSG